MSHSTSRGKGNRQRPWRDGGARKHNRGKWKASVPHAVDEFEIPDPSAHFLFEFYEPDPAECLSAIDRLLHQADVLYSIKSRGKTGFFGITEFSKYTITCSALHTELARSIVNEAGGSVQST